MKIKKGDNVIVTKGADRGKHGKVIKSLPEIGKVVVEGLNVKKRHQRAKKSGQKGQIVELSHPINVSNVMLYDGSPMRVGYKVTNGKKVRIDRKTGKEI